MIVVDVDAVIKKTLKEGETEEDVRNKLKDTARDFMFRDFKTLKRQLNLPSSMTREEVIKAINTDEVVHKKYVGYLGEISVHHLLGNDWRLVFKFNDASVWGHQPDGFIAGYPYNVKTRDKNKWGLTVYENVLKEKFYVLGHYCEGFIQLIGYVTQDELQRHKRDMYGNFWCKLEELHAVEYFSPELLFTGLNYRCGEGWHAVSKTLP